MLLARARIPALVFAALVVAALGAVDGLNRLVDGDRAVPLSATHALVAALPPPPRALVPARDRAAAALRRGDVAGAAALIPHDDDPRDVDLRSQVAERQGRLADAALGYAGAGDGVRAAAVVDALRARGDLGSAVHAQEMLVAHYDAIRGVLPEAAADAWWRLGVLRATAAWAAPAEERTPLRAEALDAYRRALALSPNEETYLLAIGEAQLELDDPRQAQVVYRRALDVVPGAFDAALGLLRAHARAHECAAARTLLPLAQRTAAGEGRPWPQAIDHPPSPWDAAVRACGI